MEGDNRQVNMAPELVVPSGLARRITAERHTFSRVEIHVDGELVVDPGSEGVLQLICEGEFILRGTIRAMSFSSNERKHLLKIPHQSTPLEIVYRNTNTGGRGGNGGMGGRNTGGAGAAGTVDYGGGGGGGGGYRNARPSPIHWKGTDAQEYVGGQAGQYCGNAGGHGGMRDPRGNGGTVFLNVGGNFDGGGGRILVEGRVGGSGSDGGPDVGSGSGAYEPVNGGGGGGGGGPGGHGGFVVAYVAGEVVDYPMVECNGGPGGSSGRTRGSYPGTDGFRGQPGVSGRDYWFGPSGLIRSE